MSSLVNRMRSAHVLCLAVVLAVACGQARQVDPPATETETSDAGVSRDAGHVSHDAGHVVPPGYPAEFPDPPHVVTEGGPVLASARFIPVFFSNDDASTVASLTDFDTRYGTTDIWQQQTHEYCYQGRGTASSPEYCIGPASATAAVTIPSSELSRLGGSVISGDSIASWLKGKLQSGSPTLPAPDENTIYVLHFPSGVTIDLQGYRSCQEIGGYHSDIQVSTATASRVVYAVIPRCATFGGFSGLDAITAAESHELIEAATDPFPSLAPAFSGLDFQHSYVSMFIGASEVGDLCTQDPQGFYTFEEFPYLVQRGWSNEAVRAGHDPCVPALPGEIYFNTVAEVSDVVNVPGYGQFIGVNVTPGTPKTVTLDLYSDDDTGGPWTVEAVDGAYMLGQTADLTLNQDKVAGGNGDHIALTIELPIGANQRFRFIQLLSSLKGDQRTNWLVVGTH